MIAELLANHFWLLMCKVHRSVIYKIYHASIFLTMNNWIFKLYLVVGDRQ